ncbi:MAG TPA: histidine phosphatase family protein [Rhizobacter sp.]|nr:histidine phosphatase family protein [Rhizobacter sp.]
MAALLIVWRHPRPKNVAGRCIGLTDVCVDARKAKRLAHRIRQRARRESLPRVVWTSPLQRSAEVGRWLARWGWQHLVDARLSELDFGRWEGLSWDAIDPAEVQAWTDAFATHAPGGGESVSQLMVRSQAFLAEYRGRALCVVSHAGWINATQRVLAGQAPPIQASEWPAAVPYAAAVAWPRSAGGAESQ